MASLYQSTSQARKILIGVLLVFALITLYSLYTNFFSNDNELAGNQRARFFMESNRRFEDIEEAQIPALEVDRNAEYSLESVHSTFPDIAYVYAVEQPRESLLSFENALEVVDTLGFEPEDYEELSENDFKWSLANGTKELLYNKNDLTWDLDTEFYENPSALARKNLAENIETYINIGNRLINRLGFTQSFGFENAFIEAKFAELGLDGIFVETTTQSQADYVFIEFFRSLPLADLAERLPDVEDDSQIPEPVVGKVYSNDPRYGQVSTIASNRLEDFSTDLYQLDFQDFNYETIPGAYFIVTPDEAWTSVSQGGGSLTLLLAQGSNYFGPMTESNVRRFIANANETEIAYYEPNEWSGFVYPIYVFRGRAELEDGRQARFIIYIDAIKRL